MRAEQGMLARAGAVLARVGQLRRPHGDPVATVAAAPPGSVADASLDLAESPGESDRRTLTDPDGQAHLEQFGFAVIPALDADLLQAVRDAYVGLGPAPDDPQRAINWSFHSRSAEYKRSVKEDLLPLLRPVLDALFVDHDVYLTTFITKWPGPDGGFAVHQDPSLVDERHFRGVTIWIPLEDTGIVDGRDNGMLWMVPGSHLFSPALRLPDVDKFQFADHETAVLDRHGVGIPTSAGEAIVFDNRVLHFSRLNQTDEPRVVLSFGVRPAEAACVHLRYVDSDRLDLYEVPDDFYIDVLPAEQHLWESPDPPIAQLQPVARRWSGEEFDALCTAVAPVPRPTVPAGTATWSDPGAFCALCGSTEGLDDDLRVGRNNAQLVCAPCRDGLPATSGP